MSIRDASAYYKEGLTEMIWPVSYGFAALQAIFTEINGTGVWF